MIFPELLKYFFMALLFPGSPRTLEWKMLHLLNKDRKKHHLPALKMQEDLREVARRHSRDMARKDYFEHVNPEGRSHADRLKIAKITEVTSGENLAKIGGYRYPAHFAEQGLMNSPGHRSNILQPLYNVVGIGVIKDLRKIYYFTQNFAKRDILFTKKFPQILRFRNALHLQGEVFAHVDAILYQIKLKGSPSQFFEKRIRVSGKKFSFEITFPHPAVYEIVIFSHRKGAKSYILCNKFNLKVLRGYKS